jgi:hypothetical protein
VIASGTLGEFLEPDGRFLERRAGRGAHHAACQRGLLGRGLGERHGGCQEQEKSHWGALGILTASDGGKTELAADEHG